jgi:hypothetical protein
MKLIVCHGYYGHVELAAQDTVKTGKFSGMTQRELFNQIMKEGYGNNIPAIFHAEYNDGKVKMFKGKDASHLIDDPSVKEVTIIAPIAGGDNATPLPIGERKGEGAD